jgi:hypothetical protein
VRIIASIEDPAVIKAILSHLAGKGRNSPALRRASRRSFMHRRIVHRKPQPAATLCAWIHPGCTRADAWRLNQP